ncbi:hypothetical protein [Nonomuraea rubra]|uniref:hypothetical protein n=1 Tax=Nonomuraea rubra TaxID=46180 RepID=UPI0031E529B7
MAMALASFWKRWANVGSSLSAGISTFTATVRPRTVSSARHTSPMPPPPMRAPST